MNLSYIISNNQIINIIFVIYIKVDEIQRFRNQTYTEGLASEGYEIPTPIQEKLFQYYYKAKICWA